jgi:anti-anti-sigma factor
LADGPPSEPFDVRLVALSQDSVRVIATGELDIATVPELEAALLDEMANHRHVLLDMSGVTFMDSMGISLLVSPVNEAEVNGWNLGIRDAMADPVRRVLRLTGIDPLLPLVED